MTTQPKEWEARPKPASPSSIGRRAGPAAGPSVTGVGCMLIEPVVALAVMECGDTRRDPTAHWIHPRMGGAQSAAFQALGGRRWPPPRIEAQGGRAHPPRSVGPPAPSRCARSRCHDPPGRRALGRWIAAANTESSSARSRSSIAGRMMSTHTVSIHPNSQAGEVERDHGQVAELGPAPAAEDEHTGGGLEDRQQAG
jgi:hypothetical protein